MADEIQLSECNGDRHPEIPKITHIIDEMDTLTVCETREKNPVVAGENKEGSGICLEDKIDSLEIKENTEKEQHTIPAEDSGMLTSHNTHPKEHNNGEDSQTILEVEGDNAPAHDSPGQKEINKSEESDQEESKAEAQDLFMFEPDKPLSETREEEMLTETEEENTSIETDNDNGHGSCDDEEENGPGPIFSVSPGGSHLESYSDQQVHGNQPDISKNSYSRYDTVSYRKIRRGNTKQRIDEFESMMN